MTPLHERPFLVDARDVGINRKGVERVLASVCRELVHEHPSRYHVTCTAAGVALLAEHFPPSAVHVVPRTPQAVWEQIGLPAVAARVRAAAVYSHRECGALWGPPLLLHIPEDPEVRWRRDPPTAPNARARVAYSRAFLRHSARRAQLAVSTPSVGHALAERLGVPPGTVALVPLGVDTSVFHHVGGASDRYFFHLASGDARDRSGLVVDAYRRLELEAPPALVIGGSVAAEERSVLLRGLPPDVAARISFTGRLSDVELAARYSGCVAYVQPTSDEGFGLQQLEALACGALPIVVAIPPVVDVVGDGAVLWTAPAPDALAAAMRRAASDAALVAEARRRNPQRAAAFSWGSTAAAIHEQLVALSSP